MMSDFCPDMYMYIINMHKKSNNLVGKIAHNAEQLWHIILIKAVFFCPFINYRIYSVINQGPAIQSIVSLTKWLVKDSLSLQYAQNQAQ